MFQGFFFNWGINGIFKRVNVYLSELMYTSVSSRYRNRVINYIPRAQNIT